MFSVAVHIKVNSWIFFFFLILKFNIVIIGKLKIAHSLETDNNRAKRTIFWASGGQILREHVCWDTFDYWYTDAILGSLGALVSKWPVTYTTDVNWDSKEMVTFTGYLWSFSVQCHFGIIWYTWFIKKMTLTWKRLAIEQRGVKFGISLKLVASIWCIFDDCKVSNVIVGHSGIIHVKTGCNSKMAGRRARMNLELTDTSNTILGAIEGGCLRWF